MNKSIPRNREPFGRSIRDDEYKFLGNPLARKAADRTLTKRRRASSPGKHGVKSPYPQIVPNVLYRVKVTSKYWPNLCDRARARAQTKAA